MYIIYKYLIHFFFCKPFKYFCLFYITILSYQVLLFSVAVIDIFLIWLLFSGDPEQCTEVRVPRGRPKFRYQPERGTDLEDTNNVHEAHSSNDFDRIIPIYSDVAGGYVKHINWFRGCYAGKIQKTNHYDKC